MRTTDVIISINHVTELPENFPAFIDAMLESYAYEFEDWKMWMLERPPVVKWKYLDPCLAGGDHNYDRILFGGGMACTKCDEIEPEG